MAKSKPKAKKEKLSDVKTGSLGMGDAYAYAVGELIEQSTESGSAKSSWLGKAKVSLEAKNFVDREKLNVKK